MPIALPECYRAQSNARTTLPRTHTPLLEFKVAQAACKQRVGQIGNAGCRRRPKGRVCRARAAAGRHGGRDESEAALWSAAPAAAGLPSLPRVRGNRYGHIPSVKPSRLPSAATVAPSAAQVLLERQVLTCCTAAGPYSSINVYDGAAKASAVALCCSACCCPLRQWPQAAQTGGLLLRLLCHSPHLPTIPSQAITGMQQRAACERDGQNLQLGTSFVKS